MYRGLQNKTKNGAIFGPPCICRHLVCHTAVITVSCAYLLTLLQNVRRFVHL